MPLFALAIFCGAFLLFLVQPLMGKYLLPWFGGGPGVWTTCLLFFQTLLLGGYAYAHFLQRLAPRRQTVVHLLLLAAALACLPIIPNATWKPLGTEDPILRILLLVTVTLGLPYLVLSATGPLLQHWFSLVHPGASPYRLYALSNAGSLLALLAYPFFFEPRYARDEVAWGWSAGLVVFAVLCGACAWRVRKASRVSPVDSNFRPAAAVADPSPATPPAGSTDAEASSLPPHITPIDRFHWFALPAVASLLLVATTNKLCLDIAAVPFLWVLPLGVYLLTFIICFDHPRWYARGMFAALLGLSCFLLAYFFSISAPPLYQQVIALVGTLFVAGMVCHGELFRLRPPPAQLTGYYLAIAAGGAAGSLFVALVAPLLFGDYRELQLGLVLLAYLVGVLCWFQRARSLALGLAVGVAALLVVLPALRADGGGGAFEWLRSFGREWLAVVKHYAPAIGATLLVFVVVLRDGRRLTTRWQSRLVLIPGLFTLLLGTAFVRQARSETTGVYTAARNFYGAFKVFYYDYPRDPTMHFFILANGGINHGQQFRGGIQAGWPTTYYSETSGIGRAMAALPRGPRRIGAVGLGTGTLAAYGRHGDSLRFYEINPAVVGVASGNPFTYLRNTPATVSVALGDARLSMERELRAGHSQEFDLLVLDAFAGDAIPVHLLTREAIALYQKHLRPGGVIAVHISNRHLDLRPAVEGVARDAGLKFATISDSVDRAKWWLYPTVWVLLSTDADLLANPEIADHAQEPPDATAKMVVWTDDHASLLEVMK